MHMETKTERIKHRLEQDGWYLTRHGSGHDIYRHPEHHGHYYPAQTQSGIAGCRPLHCQESGVA